MAILDAFYSLGSKVNKNSGKNTDTETVEGIASEKFPELKLEMENEKISELTAKWEKKWIESDVYSEWTKNGEESEDYWKGKQFNKPSVDKSRSMVDNVIFESLETYLPQVTRRNPDPTVQLSRKEEQSPENLKFASDLQKELAEIADEIVLRLKLKKTARHWAIYLLGAVKLGWDLDKDIPTAKVIRPKKLILDPDSTTDEEGYSGKYIGEHRKLEAGMLIDTLKAIGGETGAEQAITDKIKGDKGNKQLGTDIGFIEWWTPQYMCWTMGDKVLLKKKNPHWDYGSEKELPYGEDGNPQVDPTTGEPIKEKVEGVNHFLVPGMPWVLLSVFNLGKQPVDDTSLIVQNLANQDRVNKRNKQIDKNVDSMNGGMVVSLERAGMTLQQAGKITEALRTGGTVGIPTGSVGDAVARMSAPGLPNDVFTQLQDTRTRMRDIFGTAGSSSAGLSGEQTVRGKMQNRMLDTDRIGGGFSEYLEQMADSIYNWFVQLLYVYDDRFVGQPKPKIRVSVKEGSLLPKDSLTLANQAIELAGQNRMSLLDLYKALDYPNPEEMAANVWLEANAPEMLLANDPRIQQVIEMRQQAAEGAEQDLPSRSISFKDLPPEGQAQLAAQAGIELDAEAIAAHEEFKSSKEAEKMPTVGERSNPDKIPAQ